MRRDEWCLEYFAEEAEYSELYRKPSMQACDGGTDQLWFYEDDVVKHVQSSLCIELTGKNLTEVFMNTCDQENGNQVWKWRKRQTIVGDGQPM
jgi:hypothetical protein